MSNRSCESNTILMGRARFWKIGGGNYIYFRLVIWFVLWILKVVSNCFLFKSQFYILDPLINTRVSGKFCGKSLGPAKLWSHEVKIQKI